MRLPTGVFARRAPVTSLTGPDEPFDHLFSEHFVHDTAALGEDAVDGSSLSVSEDNPIRADPQPAVVLQGPLERLDITLAARHVTQPLTQPPPGLGSQAAYKVDHLRRHADSHFSSLSRAESGTNFIRRERCAA